MTITDPQNNINKWEEVGSLEVCKQEIEDVQEMAFHDHIMQTVYLRHSVNKIR